MSIDDLWYKNAIIYCLDVEKYQDANGDGIGDFEGLSRRLDYLSGLGVTCVWLQPFYPSPNRDNGYDVSDYYGVHERHGSLGDFVNFVQHADALGIRVIADLVANHTSIDSPWFQQARLDPKSHFRDWYVWADERPKNHKEGIVFPGEQKTTWTFDKRARLLLLPPVLRAPGRSEYLEPVRARRDPEDHGLLGAARRVGLPAGRGAVHDRTERTWRRAPDGLQPAEGVARVPDVALGRRRDAGRSERAARREPRVLRSGGRPAADDAELRGQPAAVLRPGDRGHRPAGEGARGDAQASAQRAVGPVPAQPRRARSRTPDRRAAAEGVRGVRP